MHKTAKPSVTMETDSENELEPIEDDENRLSDDEDFPVSDEDENEGIEDEEIEENEESNVQKKGGWAGSIAKILNSEKSGVLSKAKKVEELEKKKLKKSYTFEIDGEVKKENDDKKPTDEALQYAIEKRKRRERREVISI